MSCTHWGLRCMVQAPHNTPHASLCTGWRLENGNGSVQLQGVSVPGHVLASLHQEGLVGEPLYRWAWGCRPQSAA